MARQGYRFVARSELRLRMQPGRAGIACRVAAMILARVVAQPVRIRVDRCHAALHQVRVARGAVLFSPQPQDMPMRLLPTILTAALAATLAACSPDGNTAAGTDTASDADTAEPKAVQAPGFAAVGRLTRYDPAFAE